MMQRRILVNHVDGRLQILAPFAANHLVRSIPGARWYSKRGVWVVAGDLEEEAREVLDSWPGGVSYDDVRTESGPMCAACHQPMTALGDGASTHPGCDDEPTAPRRLGDTRGTRSSRLRHMRAARDQGTRGDAA